VLGPGDFIYYIPENAPRLPYDLSPTGGAHRSERSRESLVPMPELEAIYP
jgi:hypothetical protein